MINILLIIAIGIMIYGPLKNETYILTLSCALVFTSLASLLRHYWIFKGDGILGWIKVLFNHLIIWIPVLSIFWGIGKFLDFIF